MSDPSKTREPLKFTKAQFEAEHADRSQNASVREALRRRWRDTWTPPAWLPEVWLVTQPFRYCTQGEADGKCLGDDYVVPAGYRFDGASVPWPLTIFVPKTHPIYLGAAALHDYLYEKRHKDVCRSCADALFLDALLISGLNWFWAGAMYRAVRAGGWAVWYRRKEGRLGSFLNNTPALLREPLVFVATILLGIAGILGDVFLLRGRPVIRRAEEIRRRDEADASTASMRDVKKELNCGTCGRELTWT